MRATPTERLGGPGQASESLLGRSGMRTLRWKVPETAAPVASMVAEKFCPSLPRNIAARRLVQPKTRAPQPRKSTLNRPSRE